MVLETDINGIRYSLDTYEQKATVIECVDKGREGGVIIPASFFYQGIVYRMTRIGNYAFYNCSSLTAIILPEGVTSIGTRAFSGCTSLIAITLPESVTSIGTRAFSGCTSLIAITLPESVTSIGTRAFSGCTSLIAITLPESVTSIGTQAFSGCTSLTTIVVAEENKVYDSRGGCNAIIETTSNTLMASCSTTIIPESVTSIGRGAFEGCIGLTAITIPESVTSIGRGAFKVASASPLSPSPRA